MATKKVVMTTELSTINFRVFWDLINTLTPKTVNPHDSASALSSLPDYKFHI